jgi:hypothetical protein
MRSRILGCILCAGMMASGLALLAQDGGGDHGKEGAKKPGKGKHSHPGQHGGPITKKM